MNLTPKQRRNLKRWIKALRSGEYEQGRDRLCNTSGTMCCLGVAVDIEGDGWWWRKSLRQPWTYVTVDNIDAVKRLDHDGEGDWFFNTEPDDKWLLKTYGVGRDLSARLQEMNDGKSEGWRSPAIPRRSFAEIADFLEQSILNAS